MKRIPLYITASVAVLAAATAAHADQSINYGVLEEMFGEPITTNVTGTPQRASDVAANITIITADQIRQAGSRSIPQIIGIYVPGMDVLQSSITAFDVGVRGYQQPYQPRLQVLIDGRQVFNDDYSHTQWSNLPVNIDDIRQIEVVKGAASALFGSNAAGGVVNIITYNLLYDQSRVASLSYGTQNMVTGDATYTQHLSDWGGIKISAGGMGGEDFGTLRPATETGFTANPQHQYVTGSSLFKVTPDLLANMEITYSNGKDNGAERGFNIGNNVDTNYSLRGGISWQTPYGLLTNNNYFNHNSELSTYFLTPNEHTVTELLVSNLEDQFRVGSANIFRLGLEYRRKSIQQLADNNVDGAIDNENKLYDNVYTVNGTWLWQITDKLSWTNSARVDHSAIYEGGTLDPNYLVQDYNHSLNAFSANSGLVYHATDADTVRATYGRGVQLPSMLQNGTDAAPIQGGIIYSAIGNPNLKPTIVENYELGYDRALPAIDSTAKFSVYYQTNKDLISPPSQIVSTRFINFTPWLTLESVNVGSSHGAGGEVELKGKSLNGFRWDASYSLSTVADAETVATTIGYNASAPESHFRLLLGYSSGSWELDTNGQYVTSTDMLRLIDNAAFTNVPVAGYASIGARIGYTINDHYTLALSGTNLTRADTLENPYPAVQRQVFLGLTGKF